MGKRLLAAGLWLFAALYAGSMLHEVAGLHELVGLVIGLTSAAVIVADPFHRLSTARLPVPAPSEPEIESRDLPSELPKAA